MTGNLFREGPEPSTGNRWKFLDCGRDLVRPSERAGDLSFRPGRCICYYRDVPHARKELWSPFGFCRIRKNGLGRAASLVGVFAEICGP